MIKPCQSTWLARHRSGWVNLPLLVTGLLILGPLTSLDAQTISIFAADLQDNMGNPISTGAVAVLVVDTGTHGFAAPQPSYTLSLGAIWGTENKIVGLWNLNNCGCGDGILLDGTAVSYTGGVTSNQNLQLYWFPSLTLASNTLGNTSYGAYTDPVGIDGSDPWRVPRKNSSASLAFLTANEGGSNPQEAGEATNVTSVPLSAFQNWQIHYFGSTTNPAAAAGADPDGDGMSNTNEFLTGFSPINNTAYLHIISAVRSNNNIVVTYLGASGDSTWSPGIAYLTNVLDVSTGGIGGGYTSNFVSTGQTNILSGGTGLGLVTNMVDPGGATNIPSRYYRIRVLAP